MATSLGSVLKRFTPEEYLALERVAEFRNEYHDGAIIPMSGGTLNHTRIGQNLYTVLNVALQSSELFEVYGSDLKLWIPKIRKYFYPDAMVGPVQPAEHGAAQRDAIENPVMIVEVLSISTAGRDRNEKFRSYQHIESLRQYVLISQQRSQVEVFSLRHGFWVYKNYAGLDETVDLDSIGVTIPMAAIYRRVHLPPIATTED